MVRVKPLSLATFGLLVLCVLVAASVLAVAQNTIAEMKSPLSSTCGFGIGLGYSTELRDFTKDQLPFTHISAWAELGPLTKAGVVDTPPRTPDNIKYWQGEQAQLCKRTGATCLVTAYIIAGLGKHLGYKDCDMGVPNLCTNGAQVIRAHWDFIIQTYEWWAKYYADILGRDAVMMWNIEPDYTQYSVTGSDLSRDFTQQDGGIPDKELTGRYLNEIIAAIKKYLPNAKIGADISPWWNDKFQAWGNSMDLSKIDYFAASGPDSRPDSDTIKPGDGWSAIKYSDMFKWFKRPVHVDIGYGVGGAHTDNGLYGENGWISTKTIPARSANGVFGLTAQRSTGQPIYDYIRHAFEIRDQACKWTFGVDKSITPPDPETPGGPTDPETPGGPTDPETPGGPTDPETPGGPTDPETPGGPTDPETPGGPTDPETPGGPTDPETPGGPEDPDSEDPGTGNPGQPGSAGHAGFSIVLLFLSIVASSLMF